MIGGRSRSGRSSSTLRSLCRTQRWTGTSSPNTCRIALRSALEPSITNSSPCSTSRPRETRSDSSALATVAFSVLPDHRPSASFSPSVVIPNATTFVRPLISIPSSITTAKRRSASCRDIRCHSASRVRCTNARDTDDFDVDRSRSVACSPTGSCTRRYLRVETPARIRSSASAAELVAVGEMLVGLQASPRSRHPPCAPCGRLTATRRPPSVTSPSSWP